MSDELENLEDISDSVTPTRDLEKRQKVKRARSRPMPWWPRGPTSGPTRQPGRADAKLRKF